MKSVSHHRLRLYATSMMTALSGGLLLPQNALAETAIQAATQTAPAAPTAPVAAGTNNDIADIVVTANRRHELNQDVPIAITAFSADRLQQQGITKEQDLQASVPSLVVGPNGQGSRDSQSFTIRGEGATFQASPGVVVYLNEVPLPAGITLSQQGGPGNFVDLENLQVLSGPQGTLFGRNTTGGAVLLVPKKPTNNYSGWLQTRIGNYDRREIEGALNVPIIHDKLLVRVVGAYHDRDGFTHDVVWNKDRDDEHWYSGRIGITFRPTETIDNYTMIYGARSSNNGAGFINRGFNIGSADPAHPSGLAGYGLCSDTPTSVSGPYSCNVYRAVTQQADDLGPRKTALGSDVFSKTTTWGITNTTNIELSDALSLRNIISFQKLKLDYAYDSDGTILQQHDVDGNKYPAPGQATLPDGTPLTYTNAYDSGSPRDNLKQFTEELQLQGKALDNYLTYTVGGFYYEQKPDGVQQGGVVLFCPALYTGQAASCLPGKSTYGTSQTSKALYAQATFDFGAVSPALESLHLTGGYRRTWDNISGFSVGFAPQAATAGLTAKCNSTGVEVPTATAYEVCRYDAKLKSAASTWLIGLDYKVTPSTLLFAKVSRGYKSGGFNQQAVFENTRTFEPETVTSYEAGFKSDFRIANVPFRLNTTGYILNYKNSQRAGSDFNADSGAGGAVVRNADARIKGVEVEASMRPFRGLEIGGNFSYTDAKYTHYSYVTPTAMLDCNGLVNSGETVNLKCLPYQYVSPYIWSIHADATIPVGNDMGDLNFFINYSHTSSQYTDQDSIPGTQPGARLEKFGLLNMSLDWRDIARSGIDAGLFVTNATNNLYRISNANVYGGLLYDATLYGEPRMYGLKLRYHFGGE